MVGSVIVPERVISEEIALKVITLIMGGPGQAQEESGGGNLNHKAGSEEPGLGDNPTPKTFIAQKKPSSEIERITCLAYYLDRYRNVSAFKTKDLTKLNTEAAQPTFSNPTVFARNAETAGYLAKAGGGSKQISDLGESLVKVFPDREKVKKVLADYKTNRKRRAKKSRAKK